MGSEMCIRDSGGSMGTPGSVNYLFERKAVFQFDKYNDELIDLALNSDCLDILESNKSVTFEFPPSDFKNMNEKFNNNSFIPSNAEIAQIPNVGVVIDIEKFKSVSKLISALEDLDDVQDVYACLLYTSPSPRDGLLSRMPSSA